MGIKTGPEIMTKLGGKSQATGDTILLVALLIIFIASIALALPQSFTLEVDADSYTLNQDVRLFVSGPPNTAFKVRILKADVHLFSKSGTTSSEGDYFTVISLSEPGEYEAELESSRGSASTFFEVIEFLSGDEEDEVEVPWDRIDTEDVPWEPEETEGEVFVPPEETNEPEEVSVPWGTGQEDVVPPFESSPNVVITQRVQEFDIALLLESSQDPTVNKYVQDIQSSQSVVSVTAEISASDTSTPIEVQLTPEKTYFLLGEIPKFTLSINRSIDFEANVHTRVLDPIGRSTPFVPVIQDLGDNNYKIEILNERSTRPGIYKLVVEVMGHEIEAPFQWGLVSLNTKKSIYRPNETVDFEIVVLDEYGRPVCNTDLALLIRDPTNEMQILSTDNKDIVPTPECGVYAASYTAVYEGVHSVVVLARVRGIPLSFITNFTVLESYDFDIIRTARSKIDPTKSEYFNIKIDITPYVNVSEIEIREYVPSEFEILSTDAEVSESGDVKVLAWNRQDIGNAASISYTYSVPLVWPMLYKLGPVEITHENGTFKEARPWYVAVDPTTIYTSYYDDTTCPAGVDGCNNTADLPSSSVSNGDLQWAHSYNQTYTNSEIVEWDLKVYVDKSSPGDSTHVVGRFYDGESLVASCTMPTGSGTSTNTFWICSAENDGDIDTKRTDETGDTPRYPESVSGNSLTGTSYDIYIASGASGTAIQAVAVWYNRSYSDTEPNATAGSPANGTWFARSATSVNINCSATDDLGVDNVTFQQDSDGTGAYTDVYTDTDYSDGQWNWTYNPSADTGPCSSGNIGTTGTCYLGCYATDTNNQDDPTPANWSIGIDDDGPTGTTAGIIGVSEGTGWVSGTVTFTCSGATDTDSGVNSSGYIYEYTFDDAGSSGWTLISGCSTDSCSWDTSSLNDANIWIRCNSSDTVGNVGSDTAQYAGIDNAGPTSTLTLPEENGSVTTDPYTVTASVSDSGSGVSHVFFEYRENPSASWYSACNDTDGSPYQCDWDLTSLPDGSEYEVSVRANDSLNNMGDWDNHTNITVDRLAPNVQSDSPTQYEIITSSPYTLDATSSSDATAGIDNCTWEYSLADQDSWTYISSDTSSTGGWTYSWNVPADELYDVRVNCTDIAGNENSTVVENVTIDTVTSPPTCTVTYPNGGENVSGVITVQASASEPDPSDVVKNLTFNYSTDSGATWNLIGTNLTQNLSSYTYSWDTSSINSNTVLIRCLAIDTRNSRGQDDSGVVFTVDNTEPTIINESTNDTVVATNAYICLNVTVTDNFAVDLVWIEIDPPVGSNENVTLLDDGAGCDESADDDIYSKEYKSVYEGTYNWTDTYANDTAGNLNTTITGRTWTSTSLSTLIVVMSAPSSNLEINESGANSNYTHGCNVSCDAGGVDCTNVYLYPQYYSGGTWKVINTTTTDLVSNNDPISCGSLTAGGASYEFNFTVTAGVNSGGNTWPIRCEANSSNAPLENSSSVSLTINNPPTATWTSPSEGQWIDGNFTLNASDSSDIDGSLVNYLFQIDNNPSFSSPEIVYNGPSSNATLYTTSQSRCTEESSSCYLRMNVTDDDGMTNNDTIQIGIDNIGPTSTLDRPPTNTSIATNTYLINTSVTDSGSGVSWAFFEYRENPSASWYSACNDTDGSPHQCNWDLTSLPDGSEYEVSVRANDSLNNMGDWDNHTNITVDRVAPQTSLNLPANRTNTTETTITFNFTATDNVEDYLNCSIYIDSQLNATNSSTENNTLTNFVVTSFPQGSHSWYLNCSDSINSNVSLTRNFTVDYSEPIWSSQQQTVGGQSITVAHRGDPVNLSAQWDDNIVLKKAWLETNETGEWINKSGEYNSSQDLSGNSDISSFLWSNNSLTLGTTLSWRIHANDSTGNLNSTDIMSFDFWGWSKVNEINLVPPTIIPNSTTNIGCRVLDNVTSNPIQGYTVYFYNSTDFLGANSTNSNGWAFMTYSDSTEGSEQIICNITDNATMLYNASAAYQRSASLTIERGSETQTCGNIVYNGGDLYGNCSNIETTNNVYLNWSRVPDNNTENTYYIEILTNTEQPRELVTEINFTWGMNRVVDNYATGYVDPSTGTIAFSGAPDITNATVNASDSKYMVCTEGSTGGGKYAFTDGRVDFYVPELDTEVTYNKLEVKATGRQTGIASGDSLEFRIYNYGTSSFDYTLFSILDEDATWTNFSNSVTTNVENYIDTDGHVQLRLQDTLSSTGEGESVWDIDYIVLIAYYDNPTTNNVYNYTIGWINQSNGSKVISETLAMDSNDGNYTFVLDLNIPNVITIDGNMTGYLTVWLSGTPTQSGTRKNTFAIDYYGTSIKYDSSQAYYLNVSVVNSTSEVLENTKIEIFNSTGTRMSSSTLSLGNTQLSDILVLNKKYTIEITSPLILGLVNVTIVNLTLTGHTTVDPEIVENYSYSYPNLITNVTPLVALDDTDLTYGYTELAIPKNGITEINTILHCLDWDFDNSQCNSWELNDTGDFNIIENSTHIKFNVTEFDTFGGGAGNTMPNLTEIKIYDASFLGDPRVGGTLVNNGTNFTTNLFTNKTYRIEFWVRNDGRTWNLAAGDVVYHEGLNSSWDVDHIWYNDGTNTNYTGGTWSGGRVTWDASLGGQVNDGEWITFYYVANLTSNNTIPHSVFFIVNDTSKNSGSTDYSMFNVTQRGYLHVNMTTPPYIPGKGNASLNGGYKVGRNRQFVINATVTCLKGECWGVNATVRYNLSSPNPNEPISTTPGAMPFYIAIGSSPTNCGYMANGETCNVTWIINSTGALGSLWALDVLFNSSITEDNDTQDITIEITKVLIVNLNWGVVKFCNDEGTCPPLTTGNNGTLNNQGGYNVSISTNSNDADGLWIKGTDLQPQSFSGFGSVQYGIGASNISWNDDENDYESALTERLAKNYELIRSSVSSESNVTLYFWLDLPEGQYAQEYIGNLYIMANASVS